MFWYVKARTGGLGWVRPVEISSVTVWRVKAVKAGQLSAGRGEVRLVKAVEVCRGQVCSVGVQSGEAVGVR